MALGRNQGDAFVTINADLRPFSKQLNREIPKVLAEAEAAAKAESARTFERTGQRGAESFRKGFKKGGGEGPFVKVTSALAAALDDGISALPAEVKAAIVVGLAAASPFIAALLTGAISAGLIGGFAGIGVLIASQYDVVRKEGESLFGELRRQLLSAGSVFVAPTLAAIDMVRDRFAFIEIDLRSIFTTAARFITPVVDALLAFVEEALPGLDAALQNLEPLLPVLVDGATQLGFAVGEALRVITDSPFAEEALFDLLGALTGLVLVGAALLRVLTDIYGVLRLVSPLAISMDALTGSVDDVTASVADLAQAEIGLVVATKAEEQALKDQEKQITEARKAIEEYIDAQFAAEDASISFERSLDNLAETLARNGRSLDINKEKGRQNREALLRGLSDLRQERAKDVASERLTEAQADEQYQRNLARLRGTAAQYGITKKAFDELAGGVGALTTPGVIDLKLSPTTRENIEKIRILVDRYLKALGLKARTTPGSGGERVAQQYAEGGVVTGPTYALIGEAGPEAVIPLARPQRAAQVMAEAGLGGTGDVYVYIGNEQLDGRMYRVATDAQQRQAKRLYAGERGGAF